MALKVASKTQVHGLAKAITLDLQNSKTRTTTVECVGKDSLAIAIKGLALANGAVAIKGNVIVCIPGMDVQTGKDEMNRDTEMNVTVLQLKMFALTEFASLSDKR